MKMFRSLPVLALSVFSLVLASCQRHDSEAKPATVTYLRDVKPLLDERCTSCHAAGEIAFPLTDYSSVLAKKTALVAAVQQKRMPIWLAAAGHQTYKNDPSFSDAELKLVEAWQDGGFAEGDAVAKGPEKPASHGANLVDLRADVALPLQPDGETYLPDQKNADDYHCFVLDWPFDQDKYMVGFQAVPGEKSVVHHLVAYMVDARFVPMLRQLDAEEPGAGYQCFGGPLPDRLGEPDVFARMKKTYPGAFKNIQWSGEWLGHWAPGMRGNLLPDGTGLPIHPGGVLVVQVHYFTQTAPNTADEGGEIRSSSPTMSRSPA